jgi:hypothetical protein
MACSKVSLPFSKAEVVAAAKNGFLFTNPVACP